MKNVIKFFFGCALVMTMFSFTTNGSKPYSKQYSRCVTPSGQSGSYWSCTTFTGASCPANQQGEVSHECVADNYSGQ